MSYSVQSQAKVLFSLLITWKQLMLAAADRRSIAKYQPEPERRRNIGDFTGGRTRELC